MPIPPAVDARDPTQKRVLEEGQHDGNSRSAARQVQDVQDDASQYDASQDDASVACAAVQGVCEALVCKCG